MCLQVFLGTLRESEVERINDRISQAVMETCLAMTIFRDQFNMEFVAMFVILTFVKVLHWLVQDRVDYIETTPTVSTLHHLRIVTFMNVLMVSAWYQLSLQCLAILTVATPITSTNYVGFCRVSTAYSSSLQFRKPWSAVLQSICCLLLSMSFNAQSLSAHSSSTCCQPLMRTWRADGKTRSGVNRA